MSDKITDFSEYPISVYALRLDGLHLRDFLVEPTYMDFEDEKCFRFVTMGFVIFIYPSFASLAEPLKQISTSSPALIKSFDTPLHDLKFLREVWDLAAKTTEGIEF